MGRTDQTSRCVSPMPAPLLDTPCVGPIWLSLPPRTLVHLLKTRFLSSPPQSVLHLQPRSASRLSHLIYVDIGFTAPDNEKLLIAKIHDLPSPHYFQHRMVYIQLLKENLATNSHMCMYNTLTEETWSCIWQANRDF
ncbi:hypothetical protein C8R44DRAFT_809231 [Mycena epipterygia]|nr:hypothetical protein C8R44DRAFT_809231 [Mycena epipterygia]